MKKLTVERLRQLLEYDPSTGLFTWKARTSNRIRVGDVAGSIQASGYVDMRIEGVRYYAHRLAFFYMTGQWPAKDVDHKNGNKSDNRWDNLRAVTRSGNMQNLHKANKNNKHGLLGVIPRKDRFVAKITINGKGIHVGTYDTPEMAHKAYLAAKRELHPVVGGAQ